MGERDAIREEYRRSFNYTGNIILLMLSAGGLCVYVIKILQE